MAERGQPSLVPFTSFNEYETTPEGKKVPIWFALDESRPLAAFAGIWTSVRKAKEGHVTCHVFALLSRNPNAVAAPIQPKAMLDPAGRRGGRRLAQSALGRSLHPPVPLDDDQLQIVARGACRDGPAEP